MAIALSKCPLLGAKRTFLQPASISAFDPKRTSRRMPEWPPRASLSLTFAVLARGGICGGASSSHLLAVPPHGRLCSYRWLSWFAVQDRGLNYATGRDITDLKQAEEQLHILRRELADASRQATVGAMTASIAHEIKQPLTAIMTNASAGLRWLKKSDPNLTRAQSNLDDIVRASKQLGELIDSTRAMFGKASAEQDLVDVRLLVSNVLALARSELGSHQIVLRNEMGEGLPEVRASRVQLQQVILNLVMNAVEAMSSVTGRERRLTIGTYLDQPATLTMAVEDTGIGIEPAHFDRVFDPFFTTKAHGMGLGLSICRSIIEAHGGKLLASPRNPFGTSFYLSLPIFAVGSSGQSSKS